MLQSWHHYWQFIVAHHSCLFFQDPFAKMEPQMVIYKLLFLLASTIKREIKLIKQMVAKQLLIPKPVLWKKNEETIEVFLISEEAC